MIARELSSRDWPGKASAGVILGFTLATALATLFAALFSRGDSYFTAQGQVAMWLTAPIWCLVLSLCFLFRSGLQAWVLLGAANLVAWTVYAAARLLVG